jgi:PrtD family type I secretion system ABC transporter
MTKKTASSADTSFSGTTGQVNKLADVLRQCKHAFVFVFILTATAEILSVIPILYTLNLYDRVLSSRSEVTLVSLTVLVFGAYIFWSGLEWIRRRMMVRISLRIDWDLAADVFDMSFRRFVSRKKINVHQVLGDLVQLRQFLTGSPLLALMSAPFAIVFIVFGAFFHPYLALFALIASFLLLSVTYLTQKISTPLLRDANNASAEANRLAAQSLRHAETALALGMQRNLRKRWHERHQGFVSMQVSASESAGTLGSISSFLTKALPSMQMGLGIYLAIEGLITGGMVIASTFLISKSIGPIQKVLTSWKDISNARQAYERLGGLFAEDDAPHERMELPAPSGHLSVSELSAHPASSARPVLSGINFSLEPGQVLAVVGPSAAGKSSLVKSLVGVWRPSKGSVRLDGAEIADWAQDNLGRYIGYVPQEIEFFEGTIAENVARLSEVDSEKVVKATTMAGMHEIVLAFPQGYDTKLGETGFVLTGGQKQRLAIARAIYGDPCYVVMDEPNASLDEVGERCLLQTIRSLKTAGATVIFTTHRPDLVNVADCLLVLTAGKQIGFGSVADMLSAARKLREARPPQAAPQHGAEQQSAEQSSEAQSAPMTGAAA